MRSLPLAVATAVLLGLSSPGWAAAAGGLTFVDAGPLKLKSTQLDPPPENRLCNAGSRPVTLKPESAQLVLAAGDKRVQLDVKVEGDQPVDAGTCRTVTLTAHPGETIEADTTYSGVLAIVSEAGIARRNVSLAGPVTKATATAAQDPVPLDATRPNPWQDAKLNGKGNLPLKPAPAKQKLDVPRSCDAASSTTPAATGNDCLVGTIYNGTHPARVYADGTPDDQGAHLPIRIVDADHVGTYSGALDLAQTPDDSSDDVKIAVSVTDSLCWALAAIVIGVLVAFIPQLITRRCRPKDRLSDRIDAFDDGYAGAVTAFGKAAAKTPLEIDPAWLGPTPADVALVADPLEQGLKSYANSTVYLDVTSDAYKKLDETIALVEADIACLRSELAPQLAALATELAELDEFLAGASYLTTPPFVAAGRALLAQPTPPLRRGDDGVERADEPGRLSVGEALARRDAAKATIALATTWREVAGDLVERNASATRLSQLAAANPTKWDVLDRELLAQAAVTLAATRLALSSVEDADHLAAARLQHKLEDAGGELDYLSAQHAHESIPSAAPTIEAVGQLFADTEGGAELVTLLAGGTHEIRAIRAAERHAPKLVLDAIDLLVPKLEVAGRIGLDLMALGLTIFAAVVAALAAFYFGKTWGSWEDYLTVIAATAVIQSGLQSVLDLIGRLLPPVPRELIPGPLPAELLRAKAGT